MTVKREKAFRNAIASTRMEGLSFSKKSEQDCLRYLDGHLDAATLVREVLRQRFGVVGEFARGFAVQLHDLADCYPCTSVLINKFDLRSQQELDRVEAVLVTAKAAQWEESPLCSTFDFEHYKAIHRHLFCDLYEWAGVPRSINISKKGTQFCPADEIPRVSSAIFRRLAEQNFFQSLSFDDFVDAFVDFYIRTNELHPFREGNGRTQRVFLAQLAQHAGYQLDFSCIDPDELMVATIWSAQGVDTMLRQLFREMLSPLAD